MLAGSPKEIKAWKNGIFWRWFIFVGPAMLLVSAFAGSMLVSLVAMLSAWFGTKFMAGITAEDRMGRAIHRQKIMLGKLLGNPDTPKYFCVDFAARPSSIAVDPVANTVTAVCWPSSANRTTAVDADGFVTHCFSRAELIEWEAISPGAEILKSVGSVSTSTMVAMHRQNSAARQEQVLNTGLILKTDRLDLQEVFLNLNYESAKQWILLLKKFSDGELPTVSIPTEFPKL